MKRIIHIATAIAACAFSTVVLGQGRQAGTIQDRYNAKVRAIDSAVASYFNPPEIRNILTPGGFSEWSLTLKAGQVVIASARSDAFDPALEIVFIGDDGEEEVLAKNDDRYPGDQRPFLIWRCEEAGEYKLRARCFEDAAGGQFFLRTKTYDCLDIFSGRVTEMEIEAGKRFFLRISMKAGEIKRVHYGGPNLNVYPPIRIDQFISPTGLPDINLIKPIESVVPNTVMAAVDGDYYVVARTTGNRNGKVRATIEDIPVHQLEREDGRYTAEAPTNTVTLWSLNVKAGDILEVSMPELSLGLKFASAEQPDISEYDLEYPDKNPFFPHADDEEDSGPAYTGLPARAGDPRIGIYVIKRDAKLWFVSDGRGDQDSTYSLSVRSALKPFPADQEIEGELRIADTDYWAFNAEAGDVMTFVTGTTQFSERLIVRDPELREVRTVSMSLDQTSASWSMIVEKPGRYLVAVSANGNGGGGTYTLNRQVFSAREFGMDTPAQGDFSTGKVEVWKFTATPDQPLFIHWKTSSFSYTVSIRNAKGRPAPLSLTRIDDMNQFGLLKVRAPSTFLIVLTSSGKATDYSITLSAIPGYVKESGTSEGLDLADAR